ncbi:hypothetical protein [Plasticicumulans acidivorans]|uniref:Uncharacterized protein n=1 Tax=Plasticicumulans acidivorans TaxID=886464 RepID=A0A317N2C7_9GAMM|nr:hypothetical protein [Plasticicumulans acidivorans]PWV63453.1 hypothetical protein C7443_103382 [Plasticicumulans acidivorans]
MAKHAQPLMRGLLMAAALLVTVSALAAESLDGEYVSAQGGERQLTISGSDSADAVAVDMEVSVPQADATSCIAEFSAAAERQGNRLEMQLSEDDIDAECRVSIVVAGRKATVSEQGEGCSAYHGMACPFAATLERR